MSLDPNILQALSSALSDLKDNPQKPVPASIIEALAPIAKPGMKLKLDVDASQTIGAPLVVIDQAGQQADESQLFASLTKRQKQVAELIIDGRSNPEIADSLGISLATVKDHVHAILSRLELKSRVALIKAAHHSTKA
ncbi:LuxR C-terminal-related transcriptional regulator [Lentilitoribacter sp. EG35]|uniref:LuxR C-terminal-related transcriptional regulator n=1 Tax=Lentilitoribacter sp. EG35 TaxID=3234192 RepID=UPI00345FC69C